MSGDVKRFGGNRLRRTGAVLSLATVAALGTSACGPKYCLVCYTDKKDTPPTTSSSAAPPSSYNQDAPQSRTAVPDLARYKKGKVCPDTTLAIGACVVPIYRAPKIPKEPLNLSNTVNATDGMGDRQWPRIWKGPDGPQDDVTTVCQVMGEKVTDARDSDVWDVVQVPAKHASTAALYDAMNPNAVPKLGHDTIEGNDQATAVYAFVPDVFFKHGIVNTPQCTNEQNPMHYQNAS